MCCGNFIWGYWFGWMFEVWDILGLGFWLKTSPLAPTSTALSTAPSKGGLVIGCWFLENIPPCPTFGSCRKKGVFLQFNELSMAYPWLILGLIWTSPLAPTSTALSTAPSKGGKFTYTSRIGGLWIFC